MLVPARILHLDSFPFAPRFIPIKLILCYITLFIFQVVPKSHCQRSKARPWHNGALPAGTSQADLPL